MKKFTATILMFLSATAFAGNKYEMTKKGFYTGRLDDGRSCTLNITKIKKSLVFRTVESMEVEFTSPDLIQKISLVCEFNFENGHECRDPKVRGGFYIDTKAGYHADATPQILFKVKGELEWCNDLVLN